MTIRGGRPALSSGATVLFALVGSGLIAAASLSPAGSSTASLEQAGPGKASAVVLTAGSEAAPVARGQDASVAGRVAVSPVVVRLEPVPRKLKAKGPDEVRAVVANLSSARVPQLAISIRATPSSLVIRPIAPKVVHNLAAGKSVESTWSLCAQSGGTFELVSAVVLSGTVVDSQPLSVTIAASRC